MAYATPHDVLVRRYADCLSEQYAEMRGAESCDASQLPAREIRRDITVDVVENDPKVGFERIHRVIVLAGPAIILTHGNG
jgi:predicted lipase